MPSSSLDKAYIQPKKTLPRIDSNLFKLAGEITVISDFLWTFLDISLIHMYRRNNHLGCTYAVQNLQIWEALHVWYALVGPQIYRASHVLQINKGQFCSSLRQISNILQRHMLWGVLNVLNFLYFHYNVMHSLLCTQYKIHGPQGGGV